MATIYQFLDRALGSTAGVGVICPTITHARAAKMRLYRAIHASQRHHAAQGSRFPYGNLTISIRPATVDGTPQFALIATDSAPFMTEVIDLETNAAIPLPTAEVVQANEYDDLSPVPRALGLTGEK